MTLPPPLELFRKFIRFVRATRPYLSTEHITYHSSSSLLIFGTASSRLIAVLFSPDSSFFSTSMMIPNTCDSMSFRFWTKYVQSFFSVSTMNPINTSLFDLIYLSIREILIHLRTICPKVDRHNHNHSHNQNHNQHPKPQPLIHLRTIGPMVDCYSLSCSENSRWLKSIRREPCLLLPISIMINYSHFKDNFVCCSQY